MRTNEIEHVSQGTAAWDAVRAEFVEAQDGKCAICKRDLGLHVHLDHCHETGFIRGALCSSCNTKLGWWETHRRNVEAYLATSAEFAAYAAAPRLTRNERLRHYWQQKA